MRTCKTKIDCTILNTCKSMNVKIYMTTVMKYSVNTESHTDMKPRMKCDKTIRVAKGSRQMALVGGVFGQDSALHSPQKAHPVVWFQEMVSDCCEAKISKIQPAKTMYRWFLETACVCNQLCRGRCDRGQRTVLYNALKKHLFVPGHLHHYRLEEYAVTKCRRQTNAGRITIQKREDLVLRGRRRDMGVY